MSDKITVFIRVQIGPDGPIERIPVYGTDVAAIATSAFIAGVQFKADRPNFIIILTDSEQE